MIDRALKNFLYFAPAILEKPVCSLSVAAFVCRFGRFYLASLFLQRLGRPPRESVGGATLSKADLPRRALTEPKSSKRLQKFQSQDARAWRFWSRTCPLTI